jgi:hypothetical protein
MVSFVSHSKKSSILKTPLVLFFTCSFLIPSPVRGQIEYIVQPGDTLSKIAQSKIGQPVYPKHGSLGRLLSLNPSLSLKSVIHSGQKLLLPPFPEIQSSSQEAAESLPSSQTVEPKADISSRIVASLDNEIPHHLHLDTSFGITTITGIDNQNNSKATLNSSRDLSVEGSWQQEWTKSFLTTFSAKFQRIDFQSPTDSAYSLSNSQHNILALSVGTQNQLTEKFSLS